MERQKTCSLIFVNLAPRVGPPALSGDRVYSIISEPRPRSRAGDDRSASIVLDPYQEAAASRKMRSLFCVSRYLPHRRVASV